MTEPKPGAEGGGNQPPAIRITSAQELFEALRSPEIGRRLSVLAAASQAPQKAASYGPHDGRDLVDELAAQAKETGNLLLQRALLACLAAFQEARAVEAMKELFQSAADPEALLICAGRLSQEPEAEVRGLFSPYLKPEAPVVQARIAADILADLDGHSPADRVRIAVLTSRPFTTPALDDQTREAWLEELSGPRASRAKALIESLGREAFIRLAEEWPGLAPGVKAWLLGWGADQEPDRCLELIGEALKEGPDELRLAALKASAAIGPDEPLFQPQLDRLAGHPDAALRQAALRAGAKLPDPRAALAQEPEVDVRLELISLLAAEQGQGAIKDLVRLLEESDWRIRARATDELIRLGRVAVKAAEELLAHQSKEVRLAAARILLALDEEKD